MSDIAPMLKLQSSLEQVSPQLNKLKASCEGLESSFLKSVVQMMRKSAGDVHFGKDLGGDTYKSMFDDSLADILAQRDTLGVEKSMYGPMASRVLAQQTARTNAAATKVAEIKETDH